MRLTCLFFALFLLAGPASAFVPEGPEDGARDAIDNLVRAPRWALTGGSLAVSGERGLGGGLEYAVDPSVCTLDFIDASSCADVRRAIGEAAAAWADGHPLLQFTDMTGRIRPAFVRGGPASGAEIDFFGSDAPGVPAFADYSSAADTRLAIQPGEAMVLANGQVLAGRVGRIEAADVRFNAGRCYYIDPQHARADCVHFPSLALREIGRAIGLGDPEARASLNLDSNADPFDALVVDCRGPERGLRASALVNGAAVLAGRDVTGPGRWLRGLSWDDAAGRDALYPHCGIAVRDRSFSAWGAYALSRDGRREGRASLVASEAGAGEAALAACGEDCLVVSRFSGCFALARGAAGHNGVGRATSMPGAEVDAELACSERDRDCRVAVSFCAFD